MSPFAPKRPCLQSGCGELVVSGRCDKHRGQQKEQARQHDLRRGNSSERGYDARWQRFRLWFLRRHPMCESDRGCNHVTEEVHHIVKISELPDLRLDPLN
jgi:5-methylcytosine-specific restriction protein A